VAIAEGVAEELIAAGLAAVAHSGFRQVRGTDWEAEVHAACQTSMRVAVGQAALLLPPEAAEHAADHLAADLERAGASGWLGDALARSILSGAVDSRIREDLHATLGSRWDYLAAQGIELGRLIEVFPQAVVDDLFRRARPGEPLFQVLQIMQLRHEVAAIVSTMDVLRETVEGTRPSIRMPTLTTPVDLIRPSGQADGDVLDGRIVEAAALVLSRRDPPSLLDARQQLADLLAELVSGIYWRHLDVTPRTIAVEELVDQLLLKDAGAAQLLPARAYLRGRQGRLYYALADYEAFMPVAGDHRARVQADAGAMLMTLGHYPEARRVIKRALAAGLSPRDSLRTRQLELWIDDYQGRHIQVARECLRLMQMAQEQGDLANAYGAGHRAARALFAAAMSGRTDPTLLEVALREHERVSRFNEADNPYQYLWKSRIHHALHGTREDRWFHQAQERMEDAGGLAMAHIWLDRGTRALTNGRSQSRAAAGHLHIAADLWLKAPYPKGLFDASLGLGAAYAGFARTQADRRRAALHFRMAEQLAMRLGLPQLKQARRGRITALARVAIAPKVLLRSVDEQIAGLLPERLTSNRPFELG
jgi:hypothetical protein